MTDTTDLAAAPAADEAPRRSGGLSTMRLAELQGLASSLGLSGTAKMRKGDLITAIKARQSGGSAPAAAAPVGRPHHFRPRRRGPGGRHLRPRAGEHVRTGRAPGPGLPPGRSSGRHGRCPPGWAGRAARR